MMGRCYNPTNKDYATIGGVGIQVHAPWHDYAVFLRDMGDKPIDAIFTRLDRTGDFTPGNCAWVAKVHTRANRVYGIWKGAKRRCGQMGCSPQARYLGRGIEMHPKWVHDFKAFYQALGEPPTDQHQLDRIDNDKGYVPGNVHWVTPKENANNRADNIRIEIDGVTKTLQQWCEHHKVSRSLVSGRWRDLFTPASTVKNRPCAKYAPDTGEFISGYDTIKHAAAATGISYAAIAKALCGGNNTSGGFIWRYTQ